jgi:hypothetical protein
MWFEKLANRTVTRTATAKRPATRATALLTPDARPARPSPIEFITVAVNGGRTERLPSSKNHQSRRWQGLPIRTPRLLGRQPTRCAVRSGPRQHLRRRIRLRHVGIATDARRREWVGPSWGIRVGIGGNTCRLSLLELRPVYSSRAVAKKEAVARGSDFSGKWARSGARADRAAHDRSQATI